MDLIRDDEFNLIETDMNTADNGCVNPPPEAEAAAAASTGRWDVDSFAQFITRPIAYDAINDLGLGGGGVGGGGANDLNTAYLRARTILTTMKNTLIQYIDLLNNTFANISERNHSPESLIEKRRNYMNLKKIADRMVRRLNIKLKRLTNDYNDIEDQTELFNRKSTSLKNMMNSDNASVDKLRRLFISTIDTKNSIKPSVDKFNITVADVMLDYSNSSDDQIVVESVALPLTVNPSFASPLEARLNVLNKIVRDYQTRKLTKELNSMARPIDRLNVLMDRIDNNEPRVFRPRVLRVDTSGGRKRSGGGRGGGGDDDDADDRRTDVTGSMQYYDSNYSYDTSGTGYTETAAASAPTMMDTVNEDDDDESSNRVGGGIGEPSDPKRARLTRRGGRAMGRKRGAANNAAGATAGDCGCAQVNDSEMDETSASSARGRPREYNDLLKLLTLPDFSKTLWNRAVLKRLTSIEKNAHLLYVVHLYRVYKEYETDQNKLKVLRLNFEPLFYKHLHLLEHLFNYYKPTEVLRYIKRFLSFVRQCMLGTTFDAIETLTMVYGNRLDKLITRVFENAANEDPNNLCQYSNFDVAFKTGILKMYNPDSTRLIDIEMLQQQYSQIASEKFINLYSKDLNALVEFKVHVNLDPTVEPVMPHQNNPQPQPSRPDRATEMECLRGGNRRRNNSDEDDRGFESSDSESDDTASEASAVVAAPTIEGLDRGGGVEGVISQGLINRGGGRRRQQQQQQQPPATSVAVDGGGGSNVEVKNEPTLRSVE